MRKRKMYLSVEDIAELFGLSVSFAYRVVERMNADLESKNEYSCAMKSHFRKFGNQMSGSGNHLYNYVSLLA